MDMDFYKFEIDDDRFGSNYGYSISNPLQFQDAPSDLVIYMDRDTNEWIAQSGTGNDFGPEDDLDLLMSDISTTYGADGYQIEQDDDYDLSSETSDIQVASFSLSNYSHRSAMMDMLRYGIDIDVDSGTVAGKRASVSKWKRARMKVAAIPGWKMLDFDLYEFQNGKEDTFVSVANDGKWHLYSNGLDMAAFEDAETAMENADTILEAQTPGYEAPWWPIGVDTSGDEIKTAGVWKLDLDRPLTPSEKKTFLDNNVDVNEIEQDDGTNVLTMTGSDKAAADTAELLGLTHDFVQDAYTPDVDGSLDDEAPDEDVDVSDDMPDEIQQEIDESDMEEPSDTQEQKIKDGIIDLLEEWKDDSVKASRVAGQHTCPICLQTVDDDMEHCDMADMDMCPDCCKWMCEGEEGKSDKTAAYTTDYAFPWGEEDGGWYYSYYVGEPGNYDNSYAFTLQEDGDGWSFEVRYPMSINASYQSEVYPDRESCEDAAADFEHEHCQTVYDYEADNLTDFRDASVTADSHGPDCDCEDEEDDDEDKTACKTSVRSAVTHLLDDDIILYDDESKIPDPDGINVTRVDDNTIRVDADDDETYRHWLRMYGVDSPLDVELYEEDVTASVKQSARWIKLDDDEYYPGEEVDGKIADGAWLWDNPVSDYAEDSGTFYHFTDGTWGVETGDGELVDHNISTSDEAKKMILDHYGARTASVKKAHSSDIQMMLGATGYYWHLEVRDDAGNIIKEGDYASEELASKAADSMTGRENDVPVANVDGIVYDGDGGIMDDTADYDDWYDDCSDDCIEDDFEVYANDDSVAYPDDYDAYANAEE